MNTRLHFCLAGGDARQLYLADLLRQDGYRVTTLALSDSPADLSILSEADCVLLPTIPLTSNELLHAPLSAQQFPIHSILNALRPEQYIFTGKAPTYLLDQASSLGLTIREYLRREELAIANAVPTAEGAVQLAMEALPVTIHSSSILILGFGRVGQCTAARFSALGAHVTAAARSSAQRALARSMGLSAVSLSGLTALGQNWDLVINTIPAIVCRKKELLSFGTPVLLELASSPGGFEMDAVQTLQLRHIPAPGLPGKVAPATAARDIQRTLYAMLEELGA